MRKILLILSLFCSLFAMRVSAVTNNALSFDGVDDFVDCGVINPSVFTIEAWVNLNTINNGDPQVIVSKLLNSGIYYYQNFEVRVNSDGKVFVHIPNGNEFYSFQSNTSLTANTWYHIAVTYDGTYGKIYINGALDVTDQPYSGYVSTDTKMYIGARPSENAGQSDGLRFNGAIDEVRIWNYALSSTEILTDMKSELTNPATTSGLIAYYKFNQGVANIDNTAITTVTDASASNLNGTIYNLALNGTSSNFVAGYNASLIANVLNVSSNDVALNNTYSSTVDVSSNTTWTAVSSDSWLIVTPNTATLGNETLNISATDIVVGSSRTATITLSATGVADQVINITQTNPATVYVSTNDIRLSSSNNFSSTVNVTSNTTWTAVSSDSWLTVSPKVATSGNATLNLSAAACAVDTKRTATVTISATNVPDIVINITEINLSVNKKVLVIGNQYNQTWLDDVVNNISNSNLFASVDGINGANVTPTLSQLKQYNSVFVFSDYPFYDATATGDTLADYVDYGGGVVCSTFATASVPIGGRFNTDNYWAIAPSGQQNSSSVTLGTVYQPTSPLMAGVTSFNGGDESYRGTSTDVATGATRIADWSDGVPLIATKTIKGINRVDLGFYPVSDKAQSDLWNSSTDGVRIITNALLFASAAQDIVLTTTVPTVITSSSAIGAGNITQLGKTSTTTEHGLVWSTSSNPTTDLTTKTKEGAVAAIGAYSNNISDLLPNTTYYVRAYATNSIGTYYGNEVSFTTATITDVSNIYTSKTIVYPNPTSDLLKLSSTEGIQNISINNLSGNTVWSGSVSEFPLNVTSFAKGIYLVNIVSTDGVKTEKVVIK
jgi:hypothetical protein